MKDFLLSILNICPHDYGWPQFRANSDGVGLDYQTCTKCGSERVSKIQFVATHKY